MQSDAHWCCATAAAQTVAYYDNLPQDQLAASVYPYRCSLLDAVTAAGAASLGQLVSWEHCGQLRLLPLVCAG